MYWRLSELRQNNYSNKYSFNSFIISGFLQYGNLLYKSLFNIAILSSNFMYRGGPLEHEEVQLSF